MGISRSCTWALLTSLWTVSVATSADSVPLENRAPGTVSRSAVSAAVPSGAYGHSPRYFEPNAGQFDRQARYLSRGAGYTLFLTDTEAVMVLTRSVRPPTRPRLPENLPNPEQTVVRLKLAGARPPSTWDSLERQPGISNYFLGNDPRKWRANIPNYGAVEAHGVYPGIDWIWHGHEGQLEYDLTVAPGADPNQVQLVWEGGDSLRLNAEGDLVLATRLGDVVQQRPRVYQEAGRNRVEVASRYVLTGNRVRFALGPYDRRRELRIDPVISLDYSTYLGGSASDRGEAIAVDGAGSAYVTGYTYSANFPTDGPYQGTLKGSGNAFVTKFAPGGTTLVYSTYLGGSTNDFGQGIAVDSQGSAYIAGYTYSTDFPIVSAFLATFPTVKGHLSGFVTKLAPAGNALDYSSYLGGGSPAAMDSAWAIAVDGVGSAYVTGYTNSSNFPTQSPYQAQLAGQTNAFVAKVAPAGNSLVWSTYVGGSGTDQALGIAVDAENSPYIVGLTSSTNYPTQSPFQSQNNGEDTFVTKFSPDGSKLVYSTYLGGGGYDWGYAIAVDTAGSAYVAGQVGSNNFPTTSLAYQTTNHGFAQGGYNSYVAKFSPDGSTLVYSTLLGGTTPSGDQAFAIAVDPEGSAYVTGVARSSDFPTQAAIQTTNTAGYAVFVSKFSPDGGQLVYSTFLGVSYGETGQGIAVDGAGAAYLTGVTGATGYLTQSPYQTTNTGGGAFVTKVAPYPSANQYLLTTSVSPGAGGSISAVPVSSNLYYDFGTSVQLTAVAASGYGFSGFTGDLTGSTNPQTVVMSAARTVTASFAPLAKLSIVKSHSGNFTQGQSGATYSVTVSNAAGAPSTTGRVTVTEMAPAGLTLVSMNGGATWNCTVLPTCTANTVLNGGSAYPAITVTVNVAANAPASVANQVGVTGGNSATANYSDPTTITDPCDVNHYGTTTVADVQTLLKEALGVAKAVNDLGHSGTVNVGDVQLVINSAVGMGCFGS